MPNYRDYGRWNLYEDDAREVNLGLFIINQFKSTLSVETDAEDFWRYQQQQSAQRGIDDAHRREQPWQIVLNIRRLMRQQQYKLRMYVCFIVDKNKSYDFVDCIMHVVRCKLPIMRWKVSNNMNGDPLILLA